MNGPADELTVLREFAQAHDAYERAAREYRGGKVTGEHRVIAFDELSRLLAVRDQCFTMWRRLYQLRPAAAVESDPDRARAAGAV